MIKLTINNKEIAAFNSLELNYDLKSISNNININMPYGENLDDIFNSFIYQKCNVNFNNTLLFEGIIENWQSLTNKDNYIFQGRTLSSCFCNDSIKMNDYIYKEVSIGHVLNTVCSQHNLKTKQQIGDTKKLSYMQFMHNESFFNQIMRQLSRTSINGFVPLINTNFNSEIELAKNISNINTNPVLTLNTDNVFDAKIHLRGEVRKSEYIRYGQSIENVNISYNIKDSDINNYITKIDAKYCIGETIEELKNIASRDRAYDRMLSSQIYINYKSWFDDNNNILDVGKIVSLELPKKFLLERKRYIIETLSLIYTSKNGYFSIIKLCPENTFNVG